MNVKIKDRKNIPLRGNQTGTMFVVLRKEQGETRFEYVGSFITPIKNASISDCVKTYAEDWRAINRFRSSKVLWEYGQTLTRVEKIRQCFI